MENHLLNYVLLRKTEKKNSIQREFIDNERLNEEVLTVQQSSVQLLLIGKYPNKKGAHVTFHQQFNELIANFDESQNKLKREAQYRCHNARRRL